MPRGNLSTHKSNWWNSQSLSILLVLLLRSTTISLGFTILHDILAYVTIFQFNHRGCHILSSWMVHAGCVFVAGIHLSRTWMPGSFDFMGWNACAYKLDLGLYSHPKELGNGVKSKPMVTPREKSEGGWTCNAASWLDSEPITLPTELFWCYVYSNSLNQKMLSQCTTTIHRRVLEPKDAQPKLLTVHNKVSFHAPFASGHILTFSKSSLLLLVFLNNENFLDQSSRTKDPNF